MGWKGTYRSLRAAARRAERETKRRQRELERQARELAKKEALLRARIEVEQHRERVRRLQSLHLDHAEVIPWQELASGAPPEAPDRPRAAEEAAIAELEAHRPGWLTRWLNLEDTTRPALEERVEIARSEDGMEYRRLRREHERKLEEWEETRALAQRVLAREPSAFVQVIEELDPFREVGELGSELRFSFSEEGPPQVTLAVHGDEIIPEVEKKLLKSGKLSEKKLSKSRFHALHQDYVCSAVLRVARDMFCTFPVDMVVVTAEDRLLNTQTGHLEDQPILSVVIPRRTLDSLHLPRIDPSDALENFVYEMKWKSTKGFEPVEVLDPESFSAPKPR